MTATADRPDPKKKLADLRAKLREAERLAGRRTGAAYDRHKEAMRQKSLDRTAEGRDIGPLPPVADPARRARCRHDLELFAATYFPARFYLPTSDAHREAAGHLRRCSTDGGLFVCAMPRGYGKDTWAEVAVLWALLYGLRRFVVLIQATERHAQKALRRIERELETNDLLLADFPEVCHPIRCLERITQRAKGQTLDGKPTRIEFTAEGLVLPTVDGSAASGSAVQVYGLTGALRGLTMPSPTGEPVRPDMVVINDAQTRESSKSPTQTTDREAIITDDILMLAGPTTRIAAVMLCTVIYQNDLSDRFLDPEKHPEWQQVRTKMLESFPADMALWDRYAELRRESLRSGDEGRRATEFYAENREAMDAGGRVSWPDRKKDGELSGLQSAMNIYVDNPRGFYAECQNDPQAEALSAGAKELAADLVSARLSGSERFQVPAECTRLSCMIDCGKSLHWYAVVAWTERFGGTVIDYGSWPRQNRSHFAANDPRPAIRDVVPGGAEMNEAQLVFAGLERVAAEVLGRTYYRAGGGEAQVEICLVDSGDFTKAVYQFVQRYGKAFGCPVYPSKGIGRTMTARGVSEWKRRPGERLGYHWRLTTGEERRTQSVQFDPDAWKSFLHLALTTPPGGPTGLSFYGTSAAHHAMIGEHCAAEYSEPKEVRGTWFDKWLDRPHKPDNHLWDTLVGCAVAASVLGVQFSATADGKVETPAPKKPISFADRQANRTAQPAAPGGPAKMSYAEIMKRREAERRGR